MSRIFGNNKSMTENSMVLLPCCSSSGTDALAFDSCDGPFQRARGLVGPWTRTSPNVAERRLSTGSRGQCVLVVPHNRRKPSDVSTGARCYKDDAHVFVCTIEALRDPRDDNPILAATNEASWISREYRNSVRSIITPVGIEII